MREDNDTVSMLHDDRAIKLISGVWGDEAWTWEVGKSCDSIEVYGEPGEYCYVPWFLIKKDGVIISRQNAHKCDSVLYVSMESK